jgi:hypothetical protein
VHRVSQARRGDSSVSVQFGGCDGKISNCLRVVAGWNYLRLSREQIVNIHEDVRLAEPCYKAVPHTARVTRGVVNAGS